MTYETTVLWMAQKHLLEEVCDCKQPLLTQLCEWKSLPFKPNKVTLESLIIFSIYPWLTVQ